MNNTRIGPNGAQASYRFRAEQSGRLESIRIYIMAAESGYSAGTGGTLRITVRPDDGTSNHAPTGTVLATRDVSQPNKGAGNLYTFADPPQLDAGRLYHIVFTNIDGSPGANYVSINGIFQFSLPDSTRSQHGMPNLEWAQLTKVGSGSWVPSDGGRTTPIMEVTYANGGRQGVSYMEFWVQPPSQTKTITGTQHRVRERITVSGPDRSVTAVNVRVKRVSGSGPLRVRLEEGDGTLVASGTIAASAFPQQDPSDIRDDPTWGRLRFDGPVTLRSGRTYNLEFSADGSTSYSFVAIRQGSGYGYHAATYFGDGTGQETADGGASWVAPKAWSTRNSEGDWQFYFE